MSNLGIDAEKQTHTGTTGKISKVRIIGNSGEEKQNYGSGRTNIYL